MTRTCPVCGSAAVRHQEGEYVFVWPAGFAKPQSTFPDATWEVCDDCGEEILPGELSQRIEVEHYRVQGLLTPAEVRAIRERTGLSQIGMARLLGVGDKTLARWEAGLSIQNKSTDNLIRFAASHPELFAEVEAMRDPSREQQVEAYVKHLPMLKAQNELALVAHGDLPAVDSIEGIRSRLQALLRQRGDKTDEAGT
jgi:putative zinc finger/helix-turn-helix YgiT family protein